MLQTISKSWSDLCIVAASGPSLSPAIAQLCKGVPVVAVNDAYRLLPHADLLYACDNPWWRHHKGCQEFAGERWSSHGSIQHNNKLAIAEQYEINLVRGRDLEGFSFDPAWIHYGDNSGFQAVNLAIHKLGARGRILLVGFDARIINGKRHFFGDHPANVDLRATTRGYQIWPQKFATAAERLPAGLEIINCTPGSAITCFPMMDIADALAVAA